MGATLDKTTGAARVADQLTTAPTDQERIRDQEASKKRLLQND